MIFNYVSHYGVPKFLDEWMQIAPTKTNMINVKFTGLAIGYLRPKRWHIVDFLEVFTCFCVREINGNKTPVDRPLQKGKATIQKFSASVTVAALVTNNRR